MKNIIFYSPDFSMCYSLLMFLQDRYKVTTTTDLNVLKAVVNSSAFNLVIMDTEPSEEIELFCKELKATADIPVILTYVFKSQMETSDNNIRQYVSSVFYKPFDLNEVSMKLTSLTLQ
jgi:DNA-binding NtrC family response regulator